MFPVAGYAVWFGCGGDWGGLGGAGALALQQPVLHAAFVFAPPAGRLGRAFPGNDAGHHVVEKRPVVAHQKHRAVVALQQVFQQFKGVDVQVVGGLVEHQHIGRARKQPGQQQTVALAARKAAHGRSRTRRAEQKVAQIALHVLALFANFDPFAARADEVFQRGIQVECGAHLVEIGNLQIAALAHAAAVGGQFAQHQLEQCGFARAVGADQPDLVAAQNGGRKTIHHHPAAKRLVYVLQFGHDLAGGRAAVHLHAHAAQRLAAAGALLAQSLQAANACHCTGAPRLHALANPHLFLCQQLVGARVDNRLLFQLFQLELLVLAEIAGVAAQRAAVQLHDAGADGIQKRPVVGDDHHRPGKVQQQVLQPDNGVHVQVVGGLIQQQHIGPQHQRLSQRHALGRAARKRIHPRGAVESEFLQGRLHALPPLPAVGRLDLRLQRIQIPGAAFILRHQRQHRGQPLLHRFKYRGVALQLRLLRHIGRYQPLLAVQCAVVGLVQPGQNPQQRRFARAVAPDQAHTLARGQ